MSMKTLIYIATLAAVLSSASAQLGFLENLPNQTKSALDAVGTSLSAVECTEETRSGAQCMLAPFSGTYVCRKFGSLLGAEVQHTVCATNVVQGLTLGLNNDVCGCCNGSCADVCTCACEEGKVLINIATFFGLVNRQQCVTNGFSQHATAWGNAATCVSAEQCASFASEEDQEVAESLSEEVVTEAEAFAEP